MLAPSQSFQFSHVLDPARTRQVKSTRKPAAGHVGLMIALSDSEDEAARTVREKIRDVGMIQNIPDGIELSDDELPLLLPRVNASKSSLSKAAESASNARNRQKSGIPQRVARTDPSQPGWDDAGDAKKIMASLIHDNKSKDARIKSLQKELLFHEKMAEDECPEGDSDMRNIRIKELARKSKRLTVAYERERSTVAQLQTQIKALETRLEQTSPADAAVSDERLLKLFSDVKALKEKLATATRKVEDERMQNHTLKQEIRNLQRVLAHEVGDSCNLEKLLRGDSQAKGRAEQIVLLKDKIKDLSKKLLAASSRSPEAKSGAEGDHNGIYRLELSKKKELDKANQELDAAKMECVELKKKNDALAARTKYLSRTDCRILENANKDAKSKIGILLKKGSNDDHLIVALKSELNKCKNVVSPSNDKTLLLLMQKEQEIAALRCSVAKLESRQTSAVSLFEDSPDGASTARLLAVVESLQSEVESLRSTKAAVESQLQEERHASNCLRVKMKRELGKPGAKATATKKSEVVEELRESIDILTDENEALKLSIQLSNDSKMADLKLYQELLDQTRRQLEAFSNDE
ncbi:Coiled-coil domain-containing protein 13 [Kappamyces sp. JEL0829]|nr:Coiled-coil domain-containing protein 13 [Kappamyces sp. JEL0829]